MTEGEYSDITANGTLYVGTGAVVNGATATSCNITADAMVTGLVLNGGQTNVRDTAVVSSATVNEGGFLSVYQGSVNGVEIASGGRAELYYGTGNGIYVHSGGILDFNYWGDTTASSITVENGALIRNTRGEVRFRLDSGADSIELYQANKDCVYAGGGLSGISYTGSLTLTEGEYSDITANGTLYVGTVSDQH